MGDRLNIWRPADITPLEGKPEIFLSHCKYLIADEEARESLYDWLAWLVQHPDRKMMFAVLMVGNKGTGKSWFAELMKHILGPHNCSEPSKKQIGSEFNGWLTEKLLIIIHELGKITGLADDIKEYITQPDVRLNKKGIEAYPTDNFANFLTITNEDGAVPMEETERRYLTIRCVDLPLYATAVPGGEPIKTKECREHYRMLFESLGTVGKPGDEVRRVLSWLRNRKIKLDCQSFAPDTAARSEMIEQGLNAVEYWLTEAYQDEVWPFKGAVLNVMDVVDEIPANVPPKHRTRQTVEHALRRLGCVALKIEAVQTGSGRKRLWAKLAAAVPELLESTPKTLAQLYEAGGSPPSAMGPVLGGLYE